MAQGYSKTTAINIIMNDFNNGEGIMKAWVNKQNRVVRNAYNDFTQKAVNNYMQTSKEKVLWILEVGAEHCDDCLYMSEKPPMTISEIRQEGFGLPGEGLTECNVGCRCMLQEV